jgi:beta-phosphoglucomutase-like phosphatase (HAD superfamily)
MVVEDTPSGIAAWKKAGMHVIGITSTHARGALQENVADLVIEKLVDLDVRQISG